VNGITGNRVLYPALEGSLLETSNGFFSDALRAEPVWMKAARSGLPTYVFHAPQAFPSRPQPELHIAYGYTEAALPGEMLSASALRGELGFAVGESRYRGVFVDDPEDPSRGLDTLQIASEADPGVVVAAVKPGKGGAFSKPLPAMVGGKKVWFSLRLFAMASDASSFTLYRSGTSALSVLPEGLIDGETPSLEAFAANGGRSAYLAGGFGPLRALGGTGEAEEWFLETEHHLASQLVEEARWGLSRDYRLVLLYSPIVDEVAHALYGFLCPEIESYDEAIAKDLWPTLAEAFSIQDRLLEMLLEIADHDRAHVVVLSDHGMAGIDKLVHLNGVLAKAGLLATGPEGAIDLSRTRALALATDDLSIAVNTVDRPKGIVPVEEKLSVLETVRGVLASLRDPVTGERVVTGFFEPATSGLLQPGGGSSGDLFLDLAPGYYPTTSTSSASSALVERITASGEHGFVPTRRDMLAIFAAYGPRVPKGIRLGRVHAIDVAPTLLDLLGLPSDSTLPGKSLIPSRGLLNP
jgi:predicted AlkP superfamily phosphohydrolase/phosphomutase